MPCDVKQAVAAVLTTAMFVMLVNMMSNDRFFSLSTGNKVMYHVVKVRFSFAINGFSVSVRVAFSLLGNGFSD